MTCFCGAGFNVPAGECLRGHRLSQETVAIAMRDATIAKLEQDLREARGKIEKLRQIIRILRDALKAIEGP